MKNLLMTLYFLSLITVHKTSIAQDNPVQNEMFQGIYQIIIPDLDTSKAKIGTGFVIDYRGEQFIVTVNHILPKTILNIPRPGMQYVSKYILKSGGKTEIFNGNFIFIKSLDIAIAKVTSKEKILSIHSKYLKSLQYPRRGDYAIFNGFPIMSIMGEPQQLCTILNDGNCYPFTKVGRLSGFDAYSVFSNSSFYIDAMNSTGFSGSPVFIYDNKFKGFCIRGNCPLLFTARNN